MTWPTPATDYQFNPWTDPTTGIQWIYDASIPAWARYRVDGGGTALTSYVSQVESLPDYPDTFPNDDVTEATSAATPSKIAKICDIAEALDEDRWSLALMRCTQGEHTSYDPRLLAVVANIEKSKGRSNGLEDWRRYTVDYCNALVA